MTPSGAERCRYCGRTLDTRDLAHRRHWPFCCERCRMADLGHWFAERYVISRRAENVADDAGSSPAAAGGPGDAPARQSDGGAPAEATGDNKT